MDDIQRDQIDKRIEEIRQQLEASKPKVKPKPKKLRGKFKNKNISIEILGVSERTGEYMVQIKVLVNNKPNKELLCELGTMETCYRLTENAFYTREDLDKIIEEHNLK